MARATGERFSPTGFSLTGVDSKKGINAVGSVRRAAKRKTLRVSCVMTECEADHGATSMALPL
jgi:hypothetical protein